MIVNDLKTLGEKINDDDVSHQFLMCLPPRFETLRLIIIRGGLKDLTSNQVLGDVMTQETYHVEREGDDKKEEEDKKKKSIAFKASSSSPKNKGHIRTFHPPGLRALCRRLYRPTCGTAPPHCRGRHPRTQ